MENSNYNAIIVRATGLHPLEGLDRLVGLNIQGNQVLVGKDTYEGQVGIYFPPESQLGENFCIQNDLLRRKDENGKPAGGMFDQNRRVRVQKFRGHQSAGFWIPIEAFHYLTTDHGKYPIINSEFSEFYGEIISQKYVPKSNPNNHTGLGNGKGKTARDSKIVDGQFHFHFDTSHLGRNIHKVNPNDMIAVTDKWHGCVSKDTIIDTIEFGKKTIKEIVDNRLHCHIKAYDIDAQEEVFVPIDDYYLLENDGEWFEIELSNGQKLEITSNNPVWLPELNCYREVRNLSIDDILLISEE